MRRLEQRRAAAFLWAAILDITVVGILIIVHEQDSALKALLNRVTGHHWLTKSLLTLVLFPGLSQLFYRALGPNRKPALGSDRLPLWAGILLAVTALFVAGTLVFFVVEYFVA